MGGCAPSAPPVREELIKTRQPSFSGLYRQKFVTSTAAYSLEGECDPLSYGIEYSNDESSWTSLAGDCLTGTFSIAVTVNTTLQVYVRAKTKKGYTGTSSAFVRRALPPTSSLYSFVSSGRADDEAGLGIQSTLSSIRTGETLDNGIVKIHSEMIGVIYGE